MSALICSGDQQSFPACVAVFRWKTFCRPGMYLANLCMDERPGYRGWHMHADCVVDDFGDLQVVGFNGMTATNQIVRAQQ